MDLGFTFCLMYLFINNLKSECITLITIVIVKASVSNRIVKLVRLKHNFYVPTTDNAYHLFLSTFRYLKYK